MLSHITQTASQNPVLIHAPLGRDAEGAAQLLMRENIAHYIARDVTDLCYHLDELSGAILITEEALTQDTLEMLSKQISLQPPWSDIPVILLTKPVSSANKRNQPSPFQLADTLINLMILERPIHTLTLLSAVRTALKARTRQFLTRDYLLEKDRITEALRESAAQFRTLAESLPQLVWASQPDGYTYYFNTRWYEYTGLTPQTSCGKGWASALHPDDLEHTQAVWETALHTGQFYEVEYRLKGTDNNYRWFLALGRPVRDDQNEISQWMGTCTDISDRKQWELELEVLKESAETANTRKSQFLATMSHELRTPLNAIIGYSQMLHSKMSGPLNEKQEKYAAHIYKSGNHLLEMITDILDLSKIEAGKFHVFKDYFEIAPLLEEVRDIVNDMAARNNVSLVLDIAPNVNTVYGDTSRTKQIFFNLLSNAIKFNRENGSVHVRLFITDNADSLTCEVTDTGIGITDDQIKQLFTEFYQVDNSYSRKHEGTGLGLAITRQLVELQGGSINVQSQADKGSTFTFTIPLKKAAITSEEILV